MLNLRASRSALCFALALHAFAPRASAATSASVEPPVQPCPPVMRLTDADDLLPSVPPGAPAAVPSVEPPVQPCPPVAQR
ncbi:MAG: hypothetical protein U0325_00835 [Polyangiales bacterium]